MNAKLLLPAATLALAIALAQAPFHAESTSTMSFTLKDNEPTVEIHNVVYQYTETRVSGRPAGERLALRIATHSKNAIGDIPEPGTVTLEAWPFGLDLKQKPLYAVKLEGAGAHTIDNDIWEVDRGYVDVPMWSIYKLGSGAHLFDTHTAILRFSITSDVQTPRYVGLEVPPDDATDLRLKEPHVVAVVTYASAESVLREVLITHADLKRARELRSYADTGHTVSLVETPSRRLRVSFRNSYPGDKSPALDVFLPVKGDDLDVSRAALPAGLHATAWRH